jgi:hypothetical protein
MRISSFINQFGQFVLLYRDCQNHPNLSSGKQGKYSQAATNHTAELSKASSEVTLTYVNILALKK